MGLLDLVERLLVKRIIDLNIPRTHVVVNAICGFEKTKGALISERARLLLQASDGSVRQLGKATPARGPEYLYLTA